VVQQRAVESEIVWNTIIELHLREFHQETQSTEWAQLSKQERLERREQRESAVMEVLRNPEANYDRNSALCMVQMMDCGQGQLCVAAVVVVAVVGAFVLRWPFFPSMLAATKPGAGLKCRAARAGKSLAWESMVV
jgi:hypothetical protein